MGTGRVGSPDLLGWEERLEASGDLRKTKHKKNVSGRISQKPSESHGVAGNDDDYYLTASCTLQRNQCPHLSQSGD